MSPEEMANSMLANMKDKTGKTLDAWFKVVAKTKLSKQREILNHLKSEHAVTHGYANLIAHKFLAEDSPAPDASQMIDAQYRDAKADLRPIYEALVEAISQFGSDVQIAPKKSYVSLRRNKQFAIIQPSTKTRVDVGLNLKGRKPTKRLEASGSFSAMVSHRVRLTSLEDIDNRLLTWLKQAYESA
ncbi:MAG: DUF5655 domain-containing protein [Planctomycetota bacterium]